MSHPSPFIDPLVMAVLTDDEREKILKNLKPQSRVISILSWKQSFKGKTTAVKAGDVMFKVKDGRNKMLVGVSDGRRWRVPYAYITCQAIQTAEAL